MIIIHDNYNMKTDVHKISDCEECKQLMKFEGKVCKKFQDEAQRDCNFIDNVIEMENDFE